jgi:threonine dehydratase
MDKMIERTYTHIDLSSDDTTKEHVRHMIGGQTPENIQEYLYEITFPERPGALLDFLKAVGDTWSISLFHYRSAASDSGRVLIGFESDNREKLEEKLQSASFEWARMDKNVGITAFL